MSSKIKAAPFFQVEVNGAAYPYYASNLQVIQETDKHTITLLDVLYKGPGASRGNTKARSSWSYLKEQTPVRITYGMYPTYTTDLLAYVASYKVIKTMNDSIYSGIITTRVQYTLVGVSMNMQSTVNYAWKHISPSAIASKIAVKNGLRAIVHPYKAVYDCRMQNASDFQFLCELADEIGYRFYVDNTDLYFVDPNLVIQNPQGNIPQFWALNTPGVYDTLEDFKPSVGTTTAKNLPATRTTVGISGSGILVAASNQYNLYDPFSAEPQAPIISHYDNRYPVDSYAEATQRLQSSALRNQYWATAEATLRGDTRVRPNHLVEFIGTGVPEDDKGVWLVSKATHCLYMPPPAGNAFSGKYTTEVDVLRNQSYTINYASPNALSPVTKNIPAKLVNGVWKSSNVGAQAYAN